MGNINTVHVHGELGDVIGSFTPRVFIRILPRDDADCSPADIAACGGGFTCNAAATVHECGKGKCLHSMTCERIGMDLSGVSRLSAWRMRVAEQAL